MKKLALFVLAVSAPLAAVQANPAESQPTNVAADPAEEATAAEESEPTRAERRICRRIETTGQRTAMRRVCMTSEQWRRADR